MGHGSLGVVVVVIVILDVAVEATEGHLPPVPYRPAAKSPSRAFLPRGSDTGRGARAM